MEERHLERYYGYENLVALGGFLGEKAQRVLYSLTYPGVRDAIERTGGIDASFWALLPELEFIDDEYASPESYTESADGTEEAVFADKGEGSFYQFRMIATAVCIRDGIKQKRKRFYADWKISAGLRRILDGLTPLEEVVLCEYLGLGKSKSGSVEDIVKHMNFHSTPDNIRKILYRVEAYFQRYPSEVFELTKCAKEQEEGEV